MRKSPTDSATLYSIGFVKVGNDGNKWKIVKNKNGVKRWQHITIETNEDSDDPRDYGPYVSSSQLNSVIKKFTSEQKNVLNGIKAAIIEIRKLNILADIVATKTREGYMYWSDVPYEIFLTNKKYEKILQQDYGYPYAIFTIYLLIKNGKISLNPSEMYIRCEHTFHKNLYPQIISILDKHLNGYYLWNGTSQKAIMIYYQKQKKINKIIKLPNNPEAHVSVEIIFSKDKDFRDTSISGIKEFKQIMTLIKNLDNQYSYDKNSIQFTISNIQTLEKGSKITKQIENICKSSKDIQMYEIIGENMLTRKDYIVIKQKLIGSKR